MCFRRLCIRVARQRQFHNEEPLIAAIKYLTAIFSTEVLAWVYNKESVHIYGRLGCVRWPIFSAECHRYANREHQDNFIGTNQATCASLISCFMHSHSSAALEAHSRLTRDLEDTGRVIAVQAALRADRQVLGVSTLHESEQAVPDLVDYE